MRLKNLKFFIERFNPTIIKTLFILTWVTITLVSLGFNLQKSQEKIIIIRETKSGNYIIPIAETEEIQNSTTNSSEAKQVWDSKVDAESLHAVNFIKRYLSLVYNFDKSSINDQLVKGTDLMSDAFFAESAMELNHLKESVIANPTNMTQSLEVVSITKISKENFDIEGLISTVKEAKDYSFNYLIEMKIKEAEKTGRNPWGLEVISVKETKK